MNTVYMSGFALSIRQTVCPLFLSIHSSVHLYILYAFILSSPYIKIFKIGLIDH